ncbi:MAG: sigma-70 family RNA polymerase sigma factor [Bacteroidales bacterium]|jgi:RNA polymerase sigma factor (sigma-70 family)|nr:sigma-70 family RNA polymerase sigma factor [Bacteroidales bacterium]
MNKQESIYTNIHQDIIDRCKSGEQKAQFQLYKLYYKAMYNICLRIANDSLEAEDIMQEAFLKAFDKINFYKGEVSFGAWLKKIVVNHSLDELRKRKLDTKSIEDSVYEIKDEESFDNTNEVILKVEEIKKGISKLPDGYRIVLSLYLLEGYDHDEISEILNISSSTSRSQFARAKKKLIECLKEKQTEETK